MDGQKLAGKTVVITGATSGVGEAAARALAARGARLVMIARDPSRAEAALAKLAPAASGAHAAYFADLSSLVEMRRVAAEIAANEPVLDVLVNNAGARFPERQVTADGLERTFALNHMAYYVVTSGLLDGLKRAARARIVCVASAAHVSRTLDFDDLQMARGYDAYAAYGRSKLCNILFTRALAQRLTGTAVTANALHPGFVATRFGDNDMSVKGRIIRAMRVFALSPEAGGRALVHAATAEDAERLWRISAELAQ